MGWLENCVSAIGDIFGVILKSWKGGAWPFCALLHEGTLIWFSLPPPAFGSYLSQWDGGCALHHFCLEIEFLCIWNISSFLNWINGRSCGLIHLQINSPLFAWVRASRAHPKRDSANINNCSNVIYVKEHGIVNCNFAKQVPNVKFMRIWNPTNLPRDCRFCDNSLHTDFQFRLSWYPPCTGYPFDYARPCERPWYWLARPCFQKHKTLHQNFCCCLSC